MTAQDAPIWSPAVRPAPAGPGEDEGRAGPGWAGSCGRAHAARARPVLGWHRRAPAREQPRVPPWWPWVGPGAVWVSVPPRLSSGDPAQSQLSQAADKAPAWRATAPALLHPAQGCPALSPPAQPTLCKSQLIRLHSYRRRNTGCVLSLSINAFYHPVKLIKKQNSSSHQVLHPNIINLIFQLMIVSAGRGLRSWSLFVVYN